MKRWMIALFIAVLAGVSQGCSFARMDYEMRMADLEEILSFSPYRFDRAIEIEGVAVDDGIETPFRQNLSLSLDAAAYDHEAIGVSETDDMETWFLLYAANGAYERAVLLERGFLHRTTCDAACYADQTGYTFENISNPTGFGTLPGIEATGENSFSAVVTIGSDGAGAIVAETISRALGIEPDELPERDVTIAIDFGAATDAVLVAFSYEIEDIAYASGETDNEVDVEVEFSYKMLSDFEFPDLSNYCPSFGNAMIAGSRTTSLGRTVYGYAAEDEISALRYELEPGTYQIITELVVGGRPAEIIVSDVNGTIIVSGRMDDEILSAFQIDMAGTYYVTIVRGKLNGALRITLSKLDS